MTQNRRYFSRIKLNGKTCLATVFDKQFKVQLVDQSIGGICIQGLELVNLIQDEEFIVIIEDEEFKGKCRSAYRDSDGNLQIGIQWNKQTINADKVILNTYVQNESFYFLCDILSVPDGDHFEIQLFGEVLNVKKSMIKTYTRRERMEQISDKKLGEILVQLHQLPGKSKVEEIIDREFSIDSTRKVNQVTWVDGNFAPAVG